MDKPKLRLVKRVTFVEYVRSRRITDTPAGDFVADAKRDINFPDVKDWPSLERYVLSKSRRGLITAAKSVWQGYLRSNK